MSPASEKPSRLPQVPRSTKRPVMASGAEDLIDKNDAVNEFLSRELELSMEKHTSAESQVQVTHVHSDLAIAAFACSE